MYVLETLCIDYPRDRERESSDGETLEIDVYVAVQRRREYL